MNQRAVTGADLSAYRQQVRARQEKNQGKSLWPTLEARWAALVTYAEGIDATAHTGKPMVRYQVIAAREVMRLAGSVKATDVIETVLALYLMLDQEPRRFVSDHAFKVQLIRRVRGLTRLNAGAWRDPATGKTKRAYTELTPRAAVIMAGWLIETIGPAGVRLAKLERQDAEARLKATQEFHEAMGDLV